MLLKNYWKPKKIQAALRKTFHIPVYIRYLKIASLIIRRKIEFCPTSPLKEQISPVLSKTQNSLKQSALKACWNPRKRFKGGEPTEKKIY